MLLTHFLFLMNCWMACWTTCALAKLQPTYQISVTIHNSVADSSSWILTHNYQAPWMCATYGLIDYTSYVRRSNGSRCVNKYLNCWQFVIQLKVRRIHVVAVMICEANKKHFFFIPGIHHSFLDNVLFRLALTSVKCESDCVRNNRL